MKRILLIFGLLSLLHISSNAQTSVGSTQVAPPNQVSGWVVDSLTNTVMPGVDVTVVVDGTSVQLVTTETGSFGIKLKNPFQAGNVVVKKKGYITKYIKFTNNGELGDILLVQGEDKKKGKKK